MTIRGFWLFVAVALVCGAPGVTAQPDTIEVGGQRLVRASQATRSKLFGLIDLYRVSLYAPAGVSGLTGLQRADTPKALHVDVLYDGSLPDKIPPDWKQELEPALRGSQQEKLRDAYAKLGPKDTIRIAYSPGAGTTVAISGRTVIADPQYELMAAFLDIWLGQTPTSEDLKRSLLSGL